MTSRPRDPRKLTELMTGALMTLAIEFGVAVVLFVATVIVAAGILMVT